MVPGKFINLLPPEIGKGKVSAADRAPVVPVPSSTVPRFDPPSILIPDNFWSNLKQFLTERPIAVRERADAPFTKTSFGTGIGDNLKDFFSASPVPKGPVNSKLAVAWGSNFGGFGTRIKEFFSPPKQAPLPFAVKPMKVKDIWSKDENFGWSQVIAVGLHIAVIALLVIPIFTNMMPASTEAKNKQIGVTPLDISPYVSKLPAGADKAGGGGGGGDRSPLPPTKGRAPKFKYTQFTPPEATLKNLNPKLAMDPSLLGPPELKVANPPLTNMGDPLAASVNYSGGPGGGGGIGTGESGGIGSGSGGGLGPGEGGGTGGGVFRAGLNGVGSPQCIYCPQPEYSDEARKAKYQGTVLLDVTVTSDGRVVSPIVIKGPGLGLEEKALMQVRNWKMRPAVGPSGKPVNCRVQIEVTFRLF
jgi:protein TonB